MTSRKRHKARIACLLPVFWLCQEAKGQVSKQELQLELLSRVQYPFATRAEHVLMTSAGDVRNEARTIQLGGRIYHLGVDCVLHLDAGERIRLPFRGMTERGGERGSFELRLGNGRFRLLIKLGGFDLRKTGYRLAAVTQREKSPGRKHELEPAVPRWLRLLDKELAQLGYEEGPALSIQFENLEDLLENGNRRARYLFLKDLLLPAFRKESARLSPDPGPGRRGREAFLKRRREARKNRSKHKPGAKTFHAEDLAGLPLLGFLKRTGESEFAVTQLQRAFFATKDNPAEEKLHARLLTDFLTGLRWPLPKARDAERVIRPDDSYMRHGLAEEGDLDHPALDLGSMLLRQDHSFAYWPAGTPVGRPHVHATPYQVSDLNSARPGMQMWLVELKKDMYLLRSIIVLSHVLGGESHELEGLQDGELWRSSDPLLRCLGYPKGNHVHVEVLGIYAGAPARRALFYRMRLQQSFLAARSSLTAMAPVLMFQKGKAVLERAGVRLSLLLHRSTVLLPRLRGLRYRRKKARLETPLALTQERSWQRIKGGFRLQISLGEQPGGPALVLELFGKSSSPAELDAGAVELRLRPVFAEAFGSAKPGLLPALLEDFLLPRLGQRR